MHTYCLVAKMAESLGPSSAKKTKQKIIALVARVTAKDRAKQFKEDLYNDGIVIFTANIVLTTFV